ncbi:MAG: CsbD family protein [Ilumatobacteraceae bacterium]
MGKEVDKAKGKIKQAVGDLTGNKDLKKQGKADERAGKAKGFVADLKDKADNVVDTVKDKATKH